MLLSNHRLDYLSVRALSGFVFFFFLWDPAWVPENSRGLRPPVPLGLPVTGEASWGR